MGFTHLHLHTEYSLLDSSSKISELVERVKELGMTSCAITDHGVMYGVIDFYRACKNAGIKPIIGCEVYVAPGSRFDRTPGTGAERYNHLVLLAENNTGYKNLVKLVSRGFTEGFYYKPRVDYELLTEFHEGIIATSACLAGIVATKLRNGLYDEAKEEALRLRDVFGDGNFFLELQDHGLSEQKYVNQGILRISSETGIPLIASNDCHYIYANDAPAHDILLCIQTQKKVTDEDRMRYEGGQYYIKSPEEMKELFHYIPEAIENTEEIAKRCNVEIEFGKYHLPEYPVPESYTAREYLNKLCAEGFKKRYEEKLPEGTSREELLKRLDYELNTIDSMGFVDYFLIVWDYVNFAKKNGIAVGPGRGSAAGSIVSYCLGITDIDPISYNLLFERFLNPERLTMPDIDIDFCVLRRQEVIDYVTEKYGRERVVQIVTFGTMAAKMVIRDVGRVLDLPYSYCDKVAKMIPFELKMTIDKALDKNPDFKKLYEEDEQARYLIDMSRRLEGLPRHTSIHAAGVVISKRAVEEYVPLSVGSDGAVTTQYTMVTLEELGLLKMDFLGLRNLTVIQKTVDIINKNKEKNGEEPFDINSADMDDENVFDMIGEGKTEGVFQLESSGMKEFMKELKPDNLEDVIAGISLYRPGPMDFIPKYIEGKKNAATITYDCKELEPILKATHGCIVYQEQVMQIVRDLAGYSYGRSDLLRRAMSKKKAAVMKEEKENFVYGNKEQGIPGCLSRGVSEKVASKIYDEMLDFANYAFNRSHAAAYAVITYQTAYLKYYYTKEYMAALLTSVLTNIKKIAEYVDTCRKMGITVLSPDINEGESGFSVSAEGVRYGLSAIKGLGGAVVEQILAERRRGGSFRSLSNMIERFANGELNKRSMEGLIKSGALDCLPGTRKEKMSVYASMMDSVSHEKRNKMAGQMSFFDLKPEASEMFEVKLPVLGEFEKEDLLNFEKEMLGIYINGHPLENYRKILDKNCTAFSTDFMLDEESGTVKVRNGELYRIGGIAETVSIKLTRKDDRMAFITLEDIMGNVEVIVFPRDFEKYSGIISEGRKFVIEGRAQVEEDRDAKLIAGRIIPFEDIKKELWIQFANKKELAEKEEELLDVIKNFKGQDNLVIYCREEMQRKFFSGGGIFISPELTDVMYRRFGEDNVKIVVKSIEERHKMY